MKLIVVIVLVLAAQLAGAQGLLASEPLEVSLAQEARALLALQQNHAGFGKKQVCEKVKVVPKNKKKEPYFIEKCRMVPWFHVVLAVKRNNIEPFQLVKVDGDSCASLTLKYDTVCFVNHTGKTNGVNTEYKVENPKGFKIYAVRRFVFTPSGGKTEVVYSPYSDEFNFANMRESGNRYVTRLIDGAKRELRTLGVRSSANPAQLVADRIPTATIRRLAIIEHVDHYRFGKEGILPPAREALVVYALNRELAYMYSKSTAGARGLLQYTAKTYTSIVKKYPKAKLIGNFHDAVKDARNMAKAAVLLADDDLSHLPLSLRQQVMASEALMEDFIASSYNGGVLRPRKLLEKGLDLATANGNEENKTYVLKIRSLRKEESKL